MRKSGVLTPKQMLFVDAMVRLRDQTAAALEAGCTKRSAQVQGSQWMTEPQYAHVREAVQKKLRDIDLLTTKSAADVLQYIHNAMFFEPMQYFTESDGQGGWILSVEKLKELPKEIGCLIESVERIETSRRIGSGEEATEEVETKVKVRLVSKTVMAGLAAKHQLDQHITVTTANIDWDAMLKGAYDKRGAKRVEALIEEAAKPAQLPAPKPPSSNGSNGVSNGEHK